MSPQLRSPITVSDTAHHPLAPLNLCDGALIERSHYDPSGLVHALAVKATFSEERCLYGPWVRRGDVLVRDWGEQAGRWEKGGGEGRAEAPMGGWDHASAYVLMLRIEKNKV